MTDNKLVKIDRILNEAGVIADEVAGILENLAVLYADVAAKTPGGGGDEKRLAATFSTIHAQAAKVASLIQESLS